MRESALPRAETAKTKGLASQTRTACCTQACVAPCRSRIVCMSLRSSCCLAQMADKLVVCKLFCTPCTWLQESLQGRIEPCQLRHAAEAVAPEALPAEVCICR